jgi:hypothetical protein
MMVLSSLSSSGISVLSSSWVSVLPIDPVSALSSSGISVLLSSGGSGIREILSLVGTQDFDRWCPSNESLRAKDKKASRTIS